MESVADGTILTPSTKPESAPATGAAPAALRPQVIDSHKPSIMDRVDRFISKLSTRSHFWQRVTSMVWLPYAFKSGIRMKRVDERTFSAVLPFRRINRNWYNAMAGAALLANAEIAGGMYVFDLCGGEYTVVCKNLEMRFLRPCFGPAVYKITPTEDAKALIATKREFNLTLEMDVVQQSVLPANVRPAANKVLPKGVGEKVAGKDKRVGKVVATFHVTPKQHQQRKGRKVRRVI
jgi:hypothetical protein